MDLKFLAPLAHSAQLASVVAENAADRLAGRGERPVTERRLRTTACFLNALGQVMTLLSGAWG